MQNVGSANDEESNAGLKRWINCLKNMPLVESYEYACTELGQSLDSMHKALLLMGDQTMSLFETEKALVGAFDGFSDALGELKKCVDGSAAKLPDTLEGSKHYSSELGGSLEHLREFIMPGLFFIPACLASFVLLV